MTTHDDIEIKNFTETDDKTLTTKKHDEMLLYLLNKDNIIKMIPELKKLSFTTELQTPIITIDGEIVGFHDAVITTTYKIGSVVLSKYYKTFYIEVEPNIDSFVNTLRRIKTYIHYTQLTQPEKTKDLNENYYIFTTHTRFNREFESHGIKVLMTPEE